MLLWFTQTLFFWRNENSPQSSRNTFKIFFTSSHFYDSPKLNSVKKQKSRYEALEIHLKYCSPHLHFCDSPKCKYSRGYLHFCDSPKCKYSRGFKESPWSSRKFVLKISLSLSLLWLTQAQYRKQIKCHHEALEIHLKSISRVQLLAKFLCIGLHV
jgi:hypothetical protein